MVLILSLQLGLTIVGTMGQLTALWDTLPLVNRMTTVRYECYDEQLTHNLDPTTFDGCRISRKEKVAYTQLWRPFWSTSKKGRTRPFLLFTL